MAHYRAIFRELGLRRDSARLHSLATCAASPLAPNPCPCPMLSAQFQLHAEIEQRHWWFVARRRILRAVVGQFLPPSPRQPSSTSAAAPGPIWLRWPTNIAASGSTLRPMRFGLAKQRFPQTEFIQGQAPDDLGPIDRRSATGADDGRAGTCARRFFAVLGRGGGRAARHVIC